MTNNKKTARFETLEMFGFVDGARFAWVMWEVGTEIERRCLSVREINTFGPRLDETRSA